MKTPLLKGYVFLLALGLLVCGYWLKHHAFVGFQTAELTKVSAQIDAQGHMAPNAQQPTEQPATGVVAAAPIKAAAAGDGTLQAQSVGPSSQAASAPAAERVAVAATPSPTPSPEDTAFGAGLRKIREHRQEHNKELENLLDTK